MLLAITMIGTAETMNLGIKLGLDPKLLANIMGSATGDGTHCSIGIGNNNSICRKMLAC